MTTPNLEDFDLADFAKEIKAFMEKHELSIRRWAKLTETSPSDIRRFRNREGDITIGRVAKFQKFMRTYRGAALRRAKRPARTS